jgi:transposase
VDAGGIPLAAIVTAGQDHESTSFVEVVENVRPPRWISWPLRAAGDKGYSYPHIRAWIARRGIEQVIPQRSDQIEREGLRQFDARTYKRRARVEQCVGWLKENRRVGTRYDELATSFLAFINLAIIRRYLRILAPIDPSDRTYGLPSPNALQKQFNRCPLTPTLQVSRWPWQLPRPFSFLEFAFGSGSHSSEWRRAVLLCL